MKANIKQISEKTGFSPATVSNALNHKKGVNRETATVIMDAARELGYISEEGIRKIKFVMYRRSGQIVDDTPFFGLMIDGFERACRESGYEMGMVYLERFAEDYEQQVEQLLNDITSAVVLLGTELESEDIKLFENSKCPFMTLDYWSSDMKFNGVAINNFDSMRMATHYLIEMGHREIGYLSGKVRIKAFRLRNRGYRHELDVSGIPYKEEYRIPLSTTMDGAYQDMREYLKEKPALPTAFIADNDIIALGAIKALQEAGIRVPEDGSIIGFDDLPYCEISNPRLTSMRVPKQDMGRIAVQKMIDILKSGESVKTKIEVCTDFVIRDSVKKLN
ncbi:MAG: LacI family DNA-binding transcriptional regulator [Lachnospiraceae bacterium]|nr:LacI family DNA-binding transcriptional regulator [Lachnospiraceae bacterium]